MKVSEANTDAAAFITKREYTDLPVVARFTIEGEPQSKARPRFSGKHAYTPAKTVEAQELIAWLFKQSNPTHTPSDLTEYGIVALFFAATRQRRDVDNMLKLIADGLNGIAWVDDSQVMEMTGRKTFVDNKEHARTEVLIYVVGPSSAPSKKCRQCGESFRTYKSTRDRTHYCSPKCSTKYRLETMARECVGCGAAFTARRSNQKYCTPKCRYNVSNVSIKCVQCGKQYRIAQSIAKQRSDICSPECRIAWWRNHEPKRPEGKCTTCGSDTAKKHVTTCMACQLQARLDSKR